MRTNRLIITGITVFVMLGVGLAQTRVDSLKHVLQNTTSEQQRLSVLDQLTTELVRNNDPKQAEFLRSYLNLASSLEAYDEMASKSRFLIQNYIYQGDFTKALKLCDSLLAIKELYQKESSEAHLLLKRAAVYYDEEQLQKADEDYERAADLFLKSGDSIFAADALFFSGQLNSDKKLFLKAIKKYEQAADMYRALGDEQYALFVGAELTALYSINGFVEKSLQERESMLERAVDQNDAPNQILLLGQNVNDYNKLDELVQMETDLNKMDSLVSRLKDEFPKKYHEVFILNHRIILYCKTGELSKAERLMKVLEQHMEDPSISKYLRSDLLNARATYYEAIGDQEALIPILEQLSEINDTSRLSAQTKARELLAAIYKDRGDYAKALSLYETNTKIKDSVYDAQKANAFIYYQNEFEVERKRRQLAEQDAKIDKLEADQRYASAKRNTITAVVGSVLILLMILFYIGNKQRVKEEAYKNLLLTNKVATKTEEINQLLNETIHHIKSKSRIAENLQKISVEDQGSLKSIIADLKASKADDEKLLLIKQNIEASSYEFVQRLKERHPDLTKTDVEICSLIRIGLGRNEVANLRNTSLEAVKSSRFRLKKKLKLGTDQSLDNYIKSL